MARHSPLNIEGTGLSYRDKDGKGRPTVAQVRAKDEQGRWQAKRFPVTSWDRNGVPKLPAGALDWARATRKSFVKEEAVAIASTFQDFAALLAENLKASGVSEERTKLVKTIARGLETENVTDMRRDTFPAKVQGWIAGLQVGWSLPEDAKWRRKTVADLTPSTRNKILTVCRQVTGLALKKRRIPYDPLDEIPRFVESQKLKPLFTIDELRRMVSDDARDHCLLERRRIEDEIRAIGGTRGLAIKAIAKARKVHWASIYNALAREMAADPWWLACCLMVYTGCRAQEAMHLRWEWFKWREGVITLKLTDDYGNKTDSERFIPIEPELAKLLNPLAKTSGHLLPPEIRAGGSGVQKRQSTKEGKGASFYTGAMRLYLHRIGMDAKERTAHSLRHCYITMKIARDDTNVDRLMKAVGHANITTTQSYGKLSQFYEAEVDRWPDKTLWLRRPIPEVTLKSANEEPHAPIIQ